MLISRYWSPAPKAIEEKHKQLLPVCPKTALGRKKRKAISKLFVLYANAIHSKILILQSTRLDYCMRLVKNGNLSSFCRKILEHQ